MRNAILNKICFPAFLLALVASPVHATSVSSFANGATSCRSGSKVLPPEEIMAFRGDPGTYIAATSNSNRDLGEVFADLIIDDATLLVSGNQDTDSIALAAVKNSPNQKQPLARGLGSAAIYCLDNFPDITLAIQELAASVPDPSFQNAFLIAVEDARLAALGRAGGAPAGISGPSGLIGGGSGSDNSVPNSDAGTGNVSFSLTKNSKATDVISPTSMNGM